MDSRHILVTNDDGISARGIELLATILSEMDGIRVTVVAPAHQQSATSHALTLRDPLRYSKVAEGRYAVTGTPTDAVLVGVEHLLRDDPPDLVLSGVNHGSNMGEDVTYSGTVAAALEGAILGLPSIALSCTSHHPVHWEDGVAEVLRHWLPDLMEVRFPRPAVLNVNIPDLPWSGIRGLRVAPLGSRRYHDVITEQQDPRGRPVLWIAGDGPDWEEIPGSDAILCRQGYVVVTPLRVDLTDRDVLPELAGLDRDRPVAATPREERT